VKTLAASLERIRAVAVEIIRAVKPDGSLTASAADQVGAGTAVEMRSPCQHSIKA
jgi:hypothetical protein